MTVSFSPVEILDAVRQETETSPELLQLQQRITQGGLGSDWAVQEGLIFFKVCDGKALPTPQAILRSRLNRGQHELLVQWAACSQEDDTWEPFEVLHPAYPEFELEDKLNSKEGSIDVDAIIGKQYQRRKAINKQKATN
ncbi:hypothetical protein V6N11_001319 [Hibiscus sabdariffa]|uniref:Chromo domain-containing protein n=1 Tax=Hibiscus sabdariffa TaxID=183260 RepID=A0ABR2RZD9_9ROSI